MFSDCLLVKVFFCEQTRISKALFFSIIMSGVRLDTERFQYLNILCKFNIMLIFDSCCTFDIDSKLISPSNVCRFIGGSLYLSCFGLPRWELPQNFGLCLCHLSLSLFRFGFKGNTSIRAAKDTAASGFLESRWAAWKSTNWKLSNLGNISWYLTNISWYLTNISYI